MNVQSLEKSPEVNFYQDQGLLHTLPEELIQQIFYFHDNLSTQQLICVNKLYNEMTIDITKNLTFNHWKGIESFFVDNLKFFFPQQTKNISKFIDKNLVISDKINLIMIKEFRSQFEDKVKKEFLYNLVIIEKEKLAMLTDKAKVQGDLTKLF